MRRISLQEADRKLKQVRRLLAWMEANHGELFLACSLAVIVYLFCLFY